MIVAETTPTPGKGPLRRKEYSGFESNVALIQALVPLGLRAGAGVLEEGVIALAGERYHRVAWQPGVVR